MWAQIRRFMLGTSHRKIIFATYFIGISGVFIGAYQIGKGRGMRFVEHDPRDNGHI